MSKIPKIIGALLVVLGVIGIVTTSMATPALIVSIGVRAISTLSVLSIVTTCVGGGVFALGFVPNIINRINSSNNQKMIKGKVEERKKTFDEYAKDSLNPEKTRERLDDLKESNQGLTPIVDKCVNQMDRMDKLQERYKTLLEANDAIYLNDTISVIDDAETRLCRNIRNIINCCILVEDGSAQLSDFDNEIIDKALNENESELENVNTLIHYAVNYINNYQQNGVTDMSELKAWIDVMKTSTDKKDLSLN